ncbi:hypothetical protein SAMN02745121_08404 [Nannocystis exedens]|uniref:Uncharacterized protein n=1 Tax=Nannocystis exedens TaxID=54 RepID=A0A1I2I355_9BACT|nr:hypothetical protein [Nannocystis exedens]PCC74917.1 hypothetical protein NAEX_08017 [Nannocystis exedens]SFF36624.1 hypothetical protein SAMN02745121_08404 [Nannocystis exedens]
MAVRIQFTTLLIRIDRLTAVAPDGVAAITARWSPSWRDEHLLAVAFMDMGARDLAAELEGMGLVLRDTSTGERVWRDIAVVDYYDGPTLPCAWLECDLARHVAWLKGTVPGPIAGPEREHEEAPVRVSPDKFQQLLQSQHPPLFAPPQPAAPARPTRPGRTHPGEHEAVLLPLTQQIAAELLQIIPLSARIDTVVFLAHFPSPGEVVKAGLVLHDVDGELRSMPLPPLTAEARRLLEQLSRYESGNRLTSIEIKIAGDGRVTTDFGIAPPKSREELEDLLRRRFGSVPEGKPPRPAAPQGFMGKLKALFGAGPRVTLHPQPSLRHVPPTERLSLFLDPLDGIHEGWDDEPAATGAANASTAARPAGGAPAFDLAAFHRAEAQRVAGTAAPQPSGFTPSGPQLVVPAQDGLFAAEARGFRRRAFAEFHRERPDLRFDAGHERLVRDLGPLGQLRFTAWNGHLNRADLHVEGLPSLDELLARLQPVLAALGGLGPVSSALGTRSPAGVTRPEPVTYDELRRYLVPDSPFGTKVFPCWLLGAPAHTKVGLDLGCGLPDDRPAFSYLVSIAHI